MNGYDVKLSEVHGMAQRGGSVVTHVKLSEETVDSPLIEKGDADVIIAFEELEAYRWLPYLKKRRYHIRQYSADTAYAGNNGTGEVS